jgi:hypothetical protein
LGRAATQFLELKHDLYRAYCVDLRGHAGRCGNSPDGYSVAYNKFHSIGLWSQSGLGLVSSTSLLAVLFSHRLRVILIRFAAMMPLDYPIAQDRGLPRGNQSSWTCRELPGEGNPHLVVRLEPVLKAGLEAYALAKGLSLSQLVRRVLMDFVHDVASARVYSTQEAVEYAHHRIKTLVSILEVHLCSSAVTGIQTDGQGRDPYGIALAVVKEALRLAEGEEAAKNADLRIDATRLANTATRTALAILGGQDRHETEALVDELKKTNDSMQARLGTHEKGTVANTGSRVNGGLVSDSGEKKQVSFEARAEPGRGS